MGVDNRGSGQIMGRSLSHVKKMERRASSSRFSINKEEDVKELSELRQTFEDVTGDDEALKTQAYKMIRESLLGKHLRADVVDVIEEFEHGRLLTLVKDKATKELIRRWVQKGIKHFVENEDLVARLKKWYNSELKALLETDTKKVIKKRGCLIPIEAIANPTVQIRSLNTYLDAWNTGKYGSTRGLKCWLTCDKGKDENSWRVTGPESPNAKTYKVNFGEQDSIASIRGIWRKPEKESKDANMAGWIEQITLVTTSGVTHGPYGDEGAPVQGTNRYVESPPVEGAILSHLSGSTTKGDVHIAFHWIVPATDKNDSGIYDVMQY